MEFSKQEVLSDYATGWLSRHISLIGRKEVLTGKAKFGIFGDGKEVAQLAMAKQFRNGDWRSGYYRDQTFMMAARMLSPEAFFAQLYGDTNLKHNPDNAGRSFNNHFASRSLNSDGTWKNLMTQKNSSPDISPTAGQMPRLLGLAYASKVFRQNEQLHSFSQFSDKGNEVAFGTIGDSSTSEGHFFETINAAGVLQVPLAISVWDDGYGISVPIEFQTTKNSISELLKGFERDKKHKGFAIFSAPGWNYPALCQIYEKGIALCREKHVPVLFHITEMTQPQGHSTSGSHERYKTPERLEWEKQHDPLLKMRQWVLAEKLATPAELDKIEKNALEQAKNARKTAWKRYTEPLAAERDQLIALIDKNKRCVCANEKIDKISILRDELKKVLNPIRKDTFSTAKKILRHICIDCPARENLQRDLSAWMKKNYAQNFERYSSHLYSQSEKAAIKIQAVSPVFPEKKNSIPGREILRNNFDALFEKYPELLTFGEDTGKIGGVNQTLEGLQKKYGKWRISDTGIREITIIGQGIGLALRGLRPIAEIQYFDYLLYALQTMSDDLATMIWRTKAGQKAPLIVRTRGHRLEGIWHSGSPLSMVINSIRGIYVCVPRNMTQAAGFYNTLLRSDDAALVIEPLNGYRLKEPEPQNFGDFCTPLGIPEILVPGTDISIVTYGSCVRIAHEAVRQLKAFAISCELIDVQTLLPFDREKKILESIKKTHRVLFFDEDVPGGATAYMMQKTLNEQGAFFFLDSPPQTLSAKAHRPAYGTDGDYFSNPNAEDVFEAVYQIMHESNPEKYPEIY